MISSHTENLLIITKTYPLPSAQYVEHTCVVAINDKGEFRRLYPIPFRLLDKAQQFTKWQWIAANIYETSDRRPESHRIDCLSIKLLSKIDTKDSWNRRLEIINPHIIQGGVPALEARRLQTNLSLGFIKPYNIKLEITPTNQPDWSPMELQNLRKQQGLFESDAVKDRPTLRKIPFEFKYTYNCDTDTEANSFTHMVTDWEMGALYWNCVQTYGDNWEKYFRLKVEEEFKQKDLLFLMGNMHRFQHQWLIVGLIYPPVAQARQFSLLPPTPNS